jgi:hypothetical protein
MSYHVYAHISIVHASVNTAHEPCHALHVMAQALTTAWRCRSVRCVAFACTLTGEQLLKAVQSAADG